MDDELCLSLTLSNQEKLESLVNELKMLESYYNELNSRENMISKAIADNNTTLESIKALPEKSDSEMLIPIGAGILVRVNSYTPDKFALSVGSNIVVERDKNGTINFLEERNKEIEKALTNIGTQKNELANKINAQRLEANNLVAELKTG